MNSTGIVVASGTVAYLGSAKEDGDLFPPNTMKIFVGTSILAVLTSLVQDSRIGEPVKWLAILMLITAVVRYVPSFSTKKGK